MKRTLLVLTLGALLTCPTFAQPAGSTNAPSHQGPPPGGRQGMLTDEEQQELHKAHDAALQANPDLAAEGKALTEKMEAFHKKLDAAMIKADPKVAPILAKLEAAHQHHGDQDGPPPPPPGN